MSDTPESAHEGQRQRKVTVDLWLPSTMWDSLQIVAANVNIVPINFIRKAVLLHQQHRSTDPVKLPRYADQEKLRAAYEEFKQSAELQQMFKIEFSERLRELDAVNEAIISDVDPRARGFSLVPLIVPYDVNAYMDSRVYPLESEDYYLSVHAFGLAATLELMWLYGIAGSNAKTA